MAGWHVDNQAFALATHDPLECAGHNLVVSPADEVWPSLLNEPHERILGFFLLQNLLATFQVPQYGDFLVFRQLAKLRQQSFELWV
jgi:hypothetical protein